MTNGSPKTASVTALGASVAGASGGTGILALVSTIPDGNAWKPFLTFACPTATIAIGVIWVYVKNLLESWLADQKLRWELDKAEEALRAIEADQRASQNLLQEARQKVEALRLLKLTLHTNRVKAIIEA